MEGVHLVLSFHLVSFLRSGRSHSHSHSHSATAAPATSTTISTFDDINTNNTIPRAAGAGATRVAGAEVSHEPSALYYTSVHSSPVLYCVSYPYLVQKKESAVPSSASAVERTVLYYRVYIQYIKYVQRTRIRIGGRGYRVLEYSTVRLVCNLQHDLERVSQQDHQPARQPASTSTMNE